MALDLSIELRIFMDTSSLGFSHFIHEADAVIWLTALILLFMSVATWTVAVLKGLAMRRQIAYAKVVPQFWQCASYADALAKLGTQTDNPFHALSIKGLEAHRHWSQPGGVAQSPGHQLSDTSEWMTRALSSSIDESLTRLQSGLVVLASVGSTAPFVGLFGTVWGIYHALMGIASTGSASIDQVAGPIGEALIMTALGLVVAIPAVLIYNALVRANKSLVHQLNVHAMDLHAHFMTGARIGTTALPPIGRA
jgi:biopolymer transport protein ExbB